MNVVGGRAPGAGLPPGPVLALECSGARGSVALERGDGTVAERALPDRRGHGSRILPAVRELLDEGGIPPAGLSAILVGAGPGSFTGIRVAAAAGLGLAQGTGVPLYSLSSLSAGVLPGFGPDAEGALLVCFDARGERLFIAAYRWHDGELGVTQAPRFAHLRELVEGEIALADDTRCAGAGATRHAAALTEAGYTVVPPPVGVPTAAGLLAAARRAPGLLERWESGSEPHYLRASSAERGV